MGRQKHTAEQIISKLREAEVFQAKGIRWYRHVRLRAATSRSS